VSIIKGYWALLGSPQEGTRIDLAARLANLNIVLGYESHDDTRASGTGRVMDLGLRSDEMAFGGIMDAVVEPPLWADKGREVVVCVNESGAPTLAQVNPKGMHIGRGEVSKVGGLVAGGVGSRRDFAVELSGARVSIARDGDVLMSVAGQSAAVTAAAVPFREIAEDEEVVVVVWSDLPDASPATGCTFTLKRHKSTENYSSAGAATLVNGAALVDRARNFRVFTIPGASAMDDTHYSARIVPTGGDITVGAAIGVLPRGGVSTIIDTDYAYRKAAANPAVPRGGNNAEIHVPGGWDRDELEPDAANNVYRIARQRTFTNGAFASATAWGSRTKVADKTGG